MASKENIDMDFVTQKGNSDTLKELSKQPKVAMMIPVDPLNNSKNDEVLPVVVNGTIYTIPKGVLVQVPQTIYDIVSESMAKTMQIKQEIKITE